MPRIEVPPPYLAAVFGRYLTGQNDGAPAIAAYVRAGYGYTIEGPPFVLAGAQIGWLGPRPIGLAFTVTIPGAPPP
jgi:hypothetical protein